MSGRTIICKVAVLVGKLEDEEELDVEEELDIVGSGIPQSLSEEIRPGHLSESLAELESSFSFSMSSSPLSMSSFARWSSESSVSSGGDRQWGRRMMRRWMLRRTLRRYSWQPVEIPQGAALH